MSTIPVALIGMGRMGRALAALAPERGFHVVAELDPARTDFAGIKMPQPRGQGACSKRVAHVHGVRHAGVRLDADRLAMRRNVHDRVWKVLTMDEVDGCGARRVAQAVTSHWFIMTQSAFWPVQRAC